MFQKTELFTTTAVSTGTRESQILRRLMFFEDTAQANTVSGNTTEVSPVHIITDNIRHAFPRYMV
jgi:hypothetical protein